jgi:hypothetical protein
LKQTLAAGVEVIPIKADAPRLAAKHSPQINVDDSVFYELRRNSQPPTSPFVTACGAVLYHSKTQVTKKGNNRISKLDNVLIQFAG